MLRHPVTERDILMRCPLASMSKRDLLTRCPLPNHMDKLTLTRQFWIQFEIFLGKFRKEIGIISIHTEYRVLY
jgi:hypothetical protein